jgi:N-acyl-D-aspartate/D-glutamate deacylase
MFDYLIHGAEICDGTGAQRFRADIGITNGRVSALGDAAGPARRVIDADGLIAAPGFIDVHTHYDCQISWDPALTPSCWHGVTSVVMGNCGFTIAPCRPQHRDLLIEMLLYVEGMPTDALRAGIDWQWETFPQYLDAVERLRPAINVAAFVGHSAIRYFVMQEEAAQREATPEELARMRGLVREAMQAGAIGFSTSEAPTHFFGDGTPVPSRVAPRTEILELAKALADVGRGIVEVAPRGLLGSTEQKLEDQAFYEELAEASGRPVSWAPLLTSPFDREGCLQIIEAAAAAQRRGLRVHPQVGCRPLEVRVCFDVAGIALANNPFWRAILAKPKAERREMLASRAFRDELRATCKPGGWVANLGPSWEQIFLALSPISAHAAFLDQSIAKVAAQRRADEVDTLLDLSLESDLTCQFAIPIMNNDEAMVGKLLRHPAAVLALSDAGAHVDTLADQGFTSTLLSHWVREKKVLSLEEGIRLLTTVPADLYGLTERGRLRVGGPADIVLFDADRIGLQRTELVRDLPGGAARLLQRPVGIEHVVVNGEPLIESGRQTQARSGRLLRSA